MKLKQFFLFVLLAVFCQSTFSQVFSDNKVRNGSRGGRGNIDDKQISWGYYLGFNSLDYKFKYRTNNHNDITVKTSTGFNVGLLGNLKLGKHFDFRFEPGLSFTTRTLHYPESYTTVDYDFSSTSNSEREVQSTYVYFPFLLKWSTKRIGNFKPFLIGGVSTTINLSSNEKSKDDNFSGKFRTTSHPGFLELGFGIDFYLHYFKVSPTIRGVFAVDDELVRDTGANSPWTGNISSMQTRGFFINIVVQ